MIERNLSKRLKKLSRTFPCVTVTGPRQAGKTTLCRAVFPDHTYLSLERPDHLDHATRDPLDFLERHGPRMILDEVQRAPDLFSYLQVEIDRERRPGRFVLTGSQNFLLLSKVSQTLAGRTALLELLPFAWDELSLFEEPPKTLFDALWTGAYPPIHDEGHDPTDWLSAYLATYVERDVRQLLEVRDLRTFRLFLQLCAGRTAQLVNLASLASDVGVSTGTIRSWLSVLEASYLITLVPGYHANPRKRLLKRPKLHFLDTGLCTHLLGIRSPEDLMLHHARGAIFESWVVSEILKARLARGAPSALHHVRNQKGEEIDLVIADGTNLTLIEAKSGKTVTPDAFRGLSRWQQVLGTAPGSRDPSLLVVHGGETARRYGEIEVIPWRDVPARSG